MNTPDTHCPPVLPFELLWTIGFSGKRFVVPGHEAMIRSALRLVIHDLVVKAKARNARLSAISSLARGGDIFFAETVQEISWPDSPLPWKCLLPFPWEAFIRLDLEKDKNGDLLSETDRMDWIRRAGICLSQSIPAPVIVSPSTDPAQKEQREEAYLECGYRTVDESDVMICLLSKDEYEDLQRVASRREAQPKTGHRPGTVAVAFYALATGRPLIILNAEADDVAASRRVLRGGSSAPHNEQWFVDSVVTDIVRQAASIPLAAESVQKEKISCLPEQVTAARECLVVIGAQLGALANLHQRMTRNGLRLVMRCHLAASALAAIAVTVLVVTHPETFPKMVLAAFALLSFMKPGLSFTAWWLERRLHRNGTREVWMNARLLAELCRSALATWSLPIQSINVQDDVVFPKVKRLIRTLRLLREQDAGAAVRNTPLDPFETQLEADMRAACAIYGKNRLLDQAHYYDEKHMQAQAEEHKWRGRFQIATWTAIMGGVALAVDRFFITTGSHLLNGTVERVLEATIIIAPFVAAHCLSTMTIQDTRRRCRRYAEISASLKKLANTLEHTEANPSRIRLIEHAERMLIEEQHEWFSVMRNINI